MSSRVIHKYVLPIVPDRFTFWLPSDFRFLDLQVQQGAPVVWADVWPQATLIERRFQWVQTGQTAPEQAEYLGTVQLESLLQSLVLHLYGFLPWPAPE